MSAPFFRTTVSSDKRLAQPANAGEKLIFRSDNAADTANLSITGLVAAVSTTQTNALLGKREVQTAGVFTSLTQAKLVAAQAGIVSILGQGVAAVGLIDISSQPSDGHNLKVGLVGFEQTYTFKTTLTGAANEVKIGASASATADNLKRAINNDGTAGTNYGTGTAANAYVSATVIASVLTITDRIGCKRQLAWSISQTSGTTIGIALPIGGTDGAVLATLAAGVTQVFNVIELNSETLSVATLPALVTPISDAIAIGGRPCMLRFKCADVASAITAKYQTSTDGINWCEPLTTGISLDNNTAANPLYVIPDEQNIEYIQLVILTNANTSDTALDARVIY